MKKWKEKLPVLVIALVLGLVAFIGLLWVERQSLKDLERKPVVVCIADCPAGEPVTESNVRKYFSITDVAESLVTSTTLTSLDELVGSYPKMQISDGEIIYTTMMNQNNPTENLEQPVEISVTAEIDYAVAGRIRKGDVVNVYVRDSRSNVYELILEQVVVQNVYDSTATVISNGDSNALASMFTFCVEASVAESLGKLYTGEVALLKLR